MRAIWLISSELSEISDLSLRATDGLDACFQQRLFRSCRPHLTQIPMPVEFVETLVQQQYELQRDPYGQNFPGYLDFLILLNQYDFAYATTCFEGMVEMQKTTWSLWISISLLMFYRVVCLCFYPWLRPS